MGPGKVTGKSEWGDCGAASDGLRERYRELARQGLERLPGWRDEIRRQARRLDQEKRRRVLCELAEDCILEIRRCGGPRPLTVQVGFPFPLMALEAEGGRTDGYSVRLCVRGEGIRSVQRARLMSRIGWAVSEVTPEEFSRICRDLAAARTKCLYVSPYDFLGDSFIGAGFCQRIAREYGLEVRGHHSRFADHLGALGRVRSLEEVATTVRRQDLVVLPDLIDTHFERTLSHLPAILKARAPVFLVGRNLAIDPGAERLYRVPAPDPLLRDSNIEDYMNDCMAPFLSSAPETPPPAPAARHRPDEHVAFVNPFTSRSARDLPCRLVLNTIAALARLGCRRILVSRGVELVEKDRKASSRVAAGLSRLEPPCDVVQLSFRDLGEMAEILRAEGVTIGFTGDTAVPHLMNALGIQVVTFYRPRFWDAASPQSLASDSPLGFCRYHLGQLPLLFRRSRPPGIRTLTRTIRSISICPGEPAPDPELLDRYRNGLEGLRRKEGSLLEVEFDRMAGLHGRLADSCDLRELARQFDPIGFRPFLLRPERKTGRLIHSLFRVSPVYKIAEVRFGAAKH